MPVVILPKASTDEGIQAVPMHTCSKGGSLANTTNSTSPPSSAGENGTSLLSIVLSEIERKCAHAGPSILHESNPYHLVCIHMHACTQRCQGSQLCQRSSTTNRCTHTQKHALMPSPPHRHSLPPHGVKGSTTQCVAAEKPSCSSQPDQWGTSIAALYVCQYAQPQILCTQV